MESECVGVPEGDCLCDPVSVGVLLSVPDGTWLAEDDTEDDCDGVVVDVLVPEPLDACDMDPDDEETCVNVIDEDIATLELLETELACVGLAV